tara:strand:+ start:121 stop:423 length:303 start_codon:yes stop_codon:yes gene_type:complete
MVAATKIKYYALEPLNEISGIGNKAHTRGQIVKKVWAHIKRKNLQGVQGDTCKYNGRTYKGGQVIFVGDDPILKTVCANKNKIAMVQLAKYMEKYLERAD